LNETSNEEATSSKHLSIVGTSFFHGIARLCEALLRSLEHGGVARFEEELPRADENAYSISICALAIASLESAIYRTHYSKNNSLEFELKDGAFAWLGSEFKNKHNIVNELAFVRGSILHNHLYEIEQNWVNSKPTIINIKRRSASGDGKHQKYVDSTTHKTNQSQINVVPSLIRMSDAIKVLAAVADLLSELHKSTLGNISFLNEQFKLGKKTGLTLNDLISRLTSQLEEYDSDYKPAEILIAPK
jgi:hypothetical protein